MNGYWLFYLIWVRLSFKNNTADFTKMPQKYPRTDLRLRTKLVSNFARILTQGAWENRALLWSLAYDYTYDLWHLERNDPNKSCYPHQDKQPFSNEVSSKVPGFNPKSHKSPDSLCHSIRAKLETSTKPSWLGSVKVAFMHFSEINSGTSHDSQC